MKTISCATSTLLMTLFMLAGCGEDSGSLGPLDEPVGSDLVEDIDVAPPASEFLGVVATITEYSVSSEGRPAIRIRIDNNSDESIRSVNCDVAGIQENNVIEIVNLRFAATGPVGPGERAATTDEWREVDNGFGSFDQIRWSCDWINGERSSAVDVSSGPIGVSFVEYTTSQTDRPEITLLLTNNSTFTIFNTSCKVEAKRDGIIVDAASLFFADLDDIRPGEAAEDSGTYSDLSSLEDFDSNPFDPASLNCSYLIRE